MSSSARIVTSDLVAEIDVHAWERVRTAANADVFSSLSFLRAVEQGRGAAKLGYGMVWEHAEPAAAFSWFLMRVDLAVLAPPTSRRAMSYLRPMTGQLLSPMVLFCGAPVSGGQHAMLVDPACDVEAVVQAVDEHLNRLARQHRARLVVYKELGGTEDRVRRVLEAQGLIAAPTPPMYALTTDRFASFDDYLASLKSHYRHDINRSIRKARGQALHLATYRGQQDVAEQYDERVHSLYRNVERAAAHRLEQLSREYFLALSRELPENVFLTVARLDGQVVGCHWSVLDRDTYYFLFCGLLYPANRNADVYFNLMYAELANALRSNARSVQLGQTAEQFKARLGAHPSPRTVCVRARRRALQLALRQLTPLLFAEQQALQPLSVFKAQPAQQTERPRSVPHARRA